MTKGQRQRNVTQGFTLVEVLVAVMVFAIIGLASAAVVNTMMRTSEQSEAARLRLEQLQRGMFTLEQDLRQALSRRTPAGDYYVRAGWFNPGQLLLRSELQPVRYSVNDEQQLVREHYTYVDMSRAVEPTQRIILEGVTSFDVQPIVTGSGEFAGGAMQGLAPQQGQGDGGAMAIPDGVEVTLETEQWGTIVRVFVLNGGDFSAP